MTVAVVEAGMIQMCWHRLLLDAGMPAQRSEKMVVATMLVLKGQSGRPAASTGVLLS